MIEAARLRLWPQGSGQGSESGFTRLFYDEKLQDYRELTDVITLSLLHPLHKTPVQSWSFDQESVIRVGRSTDNNVVLYSAVVSRHHVEIHRTDSGWSVKSIGTNGTYLEGRRITEVPVEDGIVIRLARSGPNIQINMSEEKRDPLKELLLSRRKAEESRPHDDTHSEVESLPHQTTVINP